MKAVTVRPIRSDADLKQAVERIEHLWGSKEGTCEFDELDVLMDLVQAYENKNMFLGPSHPLKIIRSGMEEMRLMVKDLAAAIGVHPDNFSAVLTGNRPLTLRSIVPLSEILGIPISVLVGPTEKEARDYLVKELQRGLENPSDSEAIMARLDDPGLTCVRENDREILWRAGGSPDGAETSLLAKSPEAARSIADALDLYAYVQGARKKSARQNAA